MGAVIDQWAALELAPWTGFAVGREALEAELRAAAAAAPSIFLVHIADGAVAIEEKPSGSAHDAVLAYRASLYADFLRDALAGFAVKGRGVLALDVEDLGRPRHSVPVFTFQKRRGANTILLPDVDLIGNHWYIRDPADACDYDDRLPAAVFVGATTGNPMLTAAHVREGRNQRLRSAVFFKNHPAVRFELPIIVQHDTPETLAMIEALGVQGEPRDWAEQSRYRYMLSMDGNGATCSRVYRSLLGSGVLVKYNSPYLLYYFHGLEPWVHYLPAIDDDCVLALLDEAGRHDALHRAIAARSTQFARDYLTRPQMLRYAARLVGAWLTQFGEGANWPEAPPLLIDAHAHIGGTGDVWAAPAGWLGSGGGAIEGLALVPGREIAPHDIRLCVAGPEGVLSKPVEGHVFAGTRGEGRPLHGVQIMLRGEAAANYELAYEARFLDGSVSGLTPGGSLALGAAPLSGLRIQVRPSGRP
ncbi:glycosyl transferase family 90 [Sphingomonas quercus]|uniref:Glycosyl transferase CAP10 domain-containing protein n=1 Tax=Sphingomonas quercus TaxID=2842451 RepID=A0ABS6BFS9_9SPHN|nr:glycosyl transferase family 90 [Sphingomonas quercus]MBU3077146.1 hypothetical protein [Sphingomonas quercus]